MTRRNFITSYYIGILLLLILTLTSCGSKKQQVALPADFKGPKELSRLYGVRLTSDDNIYLYNEGARWLGVPHRLGGLTKKGVDCSGFVDWTFYNATNGAYLPGRGGGAASQHGYCINISWSDALPGDLVFYADDSHVGIVCGYDSVGNILVIHCSGGQNGVVVTGREGFAVAARPDLFTD